MLHLKRLREINTRLDHFHEHTCFLRTLVEGKRQVQYLEIGTYTGSSARLMCEHPSLFATLVDPCDLSRWSLPQEKIIHNTLEGMYNYRLVRGYSNDEEIQRIFRDRMYDLVFVDGSHVYEDVLSDILLGMACLKPGGIMVIDDYHDQQHCPDVRRAVEDMVPLFEAHGCRVDKQIPNELEAKPEEFKYLNMCIVYTPCNTNIKK